MASPLPTLLRDRRVVATAQLLALAVLLGALGYAVRGIWPDAAPRLRSADPAQLAAALAVVAASYLVFVLGWVWILAGLGIRLPYSVALQSEMVSMLAKYVPGGVWTPVARVVALRRYGTYDTSLVLASIALEAGLSALAGVLVFLVGLPIAGVVDVPLAPVLGFGAVVAVLVHPRVFVPVASFLLRPFGAGRIPRLSYRQTLSVLGFYIAFWPLGGFALFLLIRSVGGDPPAAAIPFLGGAAAVGAIVAVLAVFAPSGLGVREAAMFGLVLTVAAEGAALGAVVLNRLVITVVEAGLLVGGAAAWRLRRRRAARTAAPRTEAHPVRPRA
ncbi:MAG TPA: lysylphosphatidylglycerol synthase domain-containing protein [Gaiellaceae bacterium]|nr:lysylphosphatidylglycerol synthase domain-containing protein [Gaiellaceae bacterium]